MGIQLEHVVPWGRSFDEYVAMFGLDDAALAGRILGCGDGPASFNAEATARGHRVVSCDPIYAFTPAQIRLRIDQTYPTMIDGARRHRDSFVWTRITSPEELGRVRRAAMDAFLADFAHASSARRYVAAALPRLPFADGAFDLALCSHLLLLYSAPLDAPFHAAAVDELCRVAREVRIFPLLTLDGTPSPHLEFVCSAAAQRGRRAMTQPVAYEFLKGGNEMLIIR